MSREQDDAISAARAAFDQMVAWYGVFAEGLVAIQKTLNDAGLDPETTRVLIAQQHYKLINFPDD